MPDPVSSDAKSRCWKINRGVTLERWFACVRLRVYHGFGQPQFEFEIRLGRPKRHRLPEYIELEGEPADV